MNSNHQNITFTVESEENNSLPFLNINIFCDGGKFQTLVYRKSTFRGVLTNFESFLPISYKYNLVPTFLNRDFMICSSYGTLHFEIPKLKQLFWNKGYPKNLADRCIKMYLRKVFIKHFNICIYIFSISWQEVIRNQKTTAKCYWNNFTILQIKSLFQITI